MRAHKQEMIRHKSDVEGVEFNLGRIIRRPAGRRLWMLAVVVLAGCSVAFALRVYNRGVPERASATVSSEPPTRPAVTQATILASERLEAKLTLQPEADRMRRRLGQRFQTPGREVSSMTGLLTIGTDSKPIRMTRVQDEAGERVEVVLGTGETPFSWSADPGVTSSGKPVGGVDRSLIERLVLDSPDQFVQSQLRTASYFVIAHNVMPAGSSDDYSGPVWNVVRITEPVQSTGKQPLSSYRLYYINVSTGLIDKVAYEETGQTILAELSGWTNRAGEMVATHIVWTQNRQVLMELVTSSVSHGPKQ